MPVCMDTSVYNIFIAYLILLNVFMYVGSMMTILLMAGELMYSSPNFLWNQIKTTERSF